MKKIWKSTECSKLNHSSNFILSENRYFSLVRETDILVFLGKQCKINVENYSKSKIANQVVDKSWKWKKLVCWHTSRQRRCNSYLIDRLLFHLIDTFNLSKVDENVLNVYQNLKRFKRLSKVDERLKRFKRA